MFTLQCSNSPHHDILPLVVIDDIRIHRYGVADAGGIDVVSVVVCYL